MSAGTRMRADRRRAFVHSALVRLGDPTVQAIAAKTGLSDAVVRRQLREMQAEGVAESAPTRAGDDWSINRWRAVGRRAATRRVTP